MPISGAIGHQPMRGIDEDVEAAPEQGELGNGGGCGERLYKFEDLILPGGIVEVLILSE